MSSGDYTLVRRMRQTTRLPCNTIPTTHTNFVYQQPIVQSGHMQTTCQCQYNTQSCCNSNNICNPICNTPETYVVANCQTECCNNKISSADIDCCNTNTTGKYITETKKAYKIVPIKDASVGVLVEPNLPFKVDELIGFHRKSDPSNYFNGVILDYDKETGFLSIGNFDNITGTFSDSNIYTVNAILFDPERVRLKQRMEWLYQKLYNVDLDVNPDFNPNEVSDLTELEAFLYNIYLYLFEIDIRNDVNYAVTESFLNSIVNSVYLNLFEVELDTNESFNPNGNTIKLDNLKNKIYELYFYFFEVDLEQNTTFNPNSNSN
jgi:hypothetical protein